MIARFRRFAQIFVTALLASGCAANSPTVPGASAPAWDTTPSLGARPNYAFSCDPTKYIKRSVITIAPKLAVSLPSFKVSSLITYYPVAGFCGIDNSFLSMDKVQLLKSQDFSSAPYGRIDTTIKVMSGWEGKPDIAVWEEAWLENWLRLPSEDAHLVLVHVQP